MYQNREHPMWDEAMEILCTIPKEPGCVLLHLLAKDFDMAGTYLDLIILTPKSVGVRRCKDRGHSAVAIVPAQWIKVQIQCDHYWRTVYPEQQTKGA